MSECMRYAADDYYAKIIRTGPSGWMGLVYSLCPKHYMWVSLNCSEL